MRNWVCDNKSRELGQFWKPVEFVTRFLFHKNWKVVDSVTDELIEWLLDYLIFPAPLWAAVYLAPNSNEYQGERYHPIGCPVRPPRPVTRIDLFTLLT
jgi:hypothetical protein